MCVRAYRHARTHSTQKSTRQNVEWHKRIARKITVRFDDGKEEMKSKMKKAIRMRERFGKLRDTQRHEKKEEQQQQRQRNKNETREWRKKNGF